MIVRKKNERNDKTLYLKKNIVFLLLQIVRIDDYFIPLNRISIRAFFKFFTVLETGSES